MRSDIRFPYPEVVGQLRQFGPYGPYYKVIDINGMDKENGWMLTIRVVEPNEELVYPYRKLTDDPVVH